MKRIQKKGQGTYMVTQGFTLVETLVAISILLLVIIGPMTIAAKGMQMGYYANEHTTAVFLAQEAMESIQNLRDDNALQVLYAPVGGNTTWDWYTNLLNDCKNAGGCDLVINPANGSMTYRSCLSQSCNLEKDASGTNLVYGYGIGGTLSPYTRVIRVGALSGGGVSVTVTVTWAAQLFSGGPNRTVTLQTWIYNNYAHYQ